MATVQVDPISRIEGHLGVELDVNTTTNVVEGANVHGNLWRGFENFLIGREPNDAITFTQRICGVCPVPHGTTSTYCVDSLLGYSDGYVTFGVDGSGDGKGVPAKAVHVRNLVLGAEFLMSHLTHFYHLVALSYVQGPDMPPWTPYFADAFYHPFLKADGGSGARILPDATLWGAVVAQYVKALRMRRLCLEAGALFAGRMPMTSSLVSGGVTIQDTESEFKAKCTTYYNLLSEVGEFIVKEHVPLALALGALYPAYDNNANATIAAGALGALTFGVSQPTPLASETNIGAGLGNFLAWGAFPNPTTNVLALQGGWKIGAGAVQDLCTAKTDVAAAIANVQANLTEDTKFSRYVANEDWGYATGQSYAYPGDINRTEPDRDDAISGAYSWMKAPRWKHTDGKYYAMEVGPFARMVVNGFYPVDETTKLYTAVNPGGGIAGFQAYFSDPATLDTTMIDPGLVAALSNPMGAGDIGLVGIVEAFLANMVGGLSTMDRLRGRALEAVVLVQMILGGYTPSGVAGTAGDFGAVVGGFPTGGWIGAACAVADGASYISKPVPFTVKSGFGATEAPRGALAHFATITAGKISAYQCVVPTTWNASPKDVQSTAFDATNSGRGAMEQAMVGAPYAPGTSSPGVEALRVAQSFDPCIACAVH